MKINIDLLTRIVLILVILPAMVLAQDTPANQPPPLNMKETKYGVGYQGTFPANGLSGMMDVNENITAQAIFGLFGDLKTYAGRGLYRFRKEAYWDMYGYGMIGAWSYTGLEVGAGLTLKKTTETVLGFGAGVGIEYDWRGWDAKLPPIFWNLELGIGMVNFDKVDYNFSTLLLGAGIHYRF